MIVALISLGIRPDAVEAFEAAARVNAEATVREPGCLRFEVYREAGDPTRFLLFEAFRDQAAREAHWQTAHFLAYRDATAGLTESRDVTEYEPVTSPDAEDANPEE